MLEHTTSRQYAKPAGDAKAAAPKPNSLLEFFHPYGAAHRTLMIGGNCPAVLRPSPGNEATEVADLVVFAPTAAECRARGWLEDAVIALRQRLAPEGLVYVVAPPLRRLRLTKLFHNCDLSIDHAILHLPDPVSSRYLIPLTSTPARYAVSNLLSLTFRKRLLAAVGLYLIGLSKLVQWLLPSTCLLVRRRGARPIFEWLFRLNCEPDGCVLITRSSRGKEGAVAVYCFPTGAKKPSAVAKITMKPAETVRGEATAQRRLGAIARAAGAQIPEVLSLTNLDGRSVLLQTALNGKSIGAFLASRPDRLSGVLQRLVTWLESWNESTRTTVGLDAQFLEREILVPARSVAPEIDRGNEYRQWLETACRAQAGIAIPMVTAHNDLTMWNLLLDDDDRLGVVDWESAREQDLPFVDFFYAVVDAVTIARSFEERSKTFEACFVSGGVYEPTVTRYLARLRRVIGAPDDVIELCFHACWVHHAANERGAVKPSDPRPFLEIVQWLALHRPRVSGWLRG